MWIGKQYYPKVEDFVREVNTMGLSRKIAYVPEWLKNGSILYLAREGLIDKVKGYSPKKKKIKSPGIFMAITVTGIEYILPESEMQNEELLKELEEKKITPVFVPDDDEDHKPRRKKTKINVEKEEFSRTKLGDYI
jgi:hypothetical protein